MSKVVCICGNVISDVVYPSPSNGSLISEASLAAFIDYAGSIVAELKHADLHTDLSGYAADSTQSTPSMRVMRKSLKTRCAAGFLICPWLR